MRLERCEDGTHKVWMAFDEVQELRRQATGYRDDVVIGLGARSGLRSFEIPQIKPKHVKRTTHNGGDYYFLRVPEGKHTAGGGGKPRDAYLPRDLERDLYRYIEAEGIGRDERSSTSPSAPSSGSSNGPRVQLRIRPATRITWRCRVTTSGGTSRTTCSSRGG